MTTFIKYACAPIAWTNDDLPELGGENTFEQCISEMALAGYEGTEIGNKYPKEASVLKSYLEPRGLSVASAWFSMFLTTKPYKETEAAFIKHRDFLHDMGAKVIVVSEQGRSVQGRLDQSVFDDKPHFTDEEWTRLIYGLHRLGRLAQEKNMKIVYHHHMGTGVQTTAEIQRLMEATDPKLVSLLYDTGHLHVSGEDLLAIFDTYQDRIHHIHFKDVRETIAHDMKVHGLSFLDGVKRGVFTVPGDGDIDFKPILERIHQSDYVGWIVVEAEQDPAVANPFLYAKKAKAYMEAI
ncbi:myo-inosose-2 dehydratase [Staphylococcus agnetis]|uniref:myo-inosose-2 dehydratase n=1 Tax=Staphylococcus agnetis TaxID=985762 RepID=UPI000CD110D0|nr:myo-inosose-2 dehydratase [Staphylococcus agnetis]MBY7664362.1 myo-inosose-2 dehydratase [Staphylococcus agnetis]MCO4325712.1 myo-inosose-2 dehydratase [Staphylococcus agnetis]MCO4356547.1 myo-inosose-2 dehydratase [Staphylococcus agnetis]MCO4362774.1 myo-inosose-2 dehydratase [Staphylococcus agnetis]MCO4369888.1 myo-inosose-2 dehydratase [Staphylococcus agnetis]